MTKRTRRTHSAGFKAKVALAAIKGAFLARHGGVAGLSRVSHDLLLSGYLRTDEHKELATAFAEKRPPQFKGR
jgi:naphthoate synthase